MIAGSLVLELSFAVFPGTLAEIGFEVEGSGHGIVCIWDVGIIDSSLAQYPKMPVLGLFYVRGCLQIMCLVMCSCFKHL